MNKSLKMLEYQPRHRDERVATWRLVVFYSLGAIGLLVVLGAIFFTLATIGSNLGLW